MGWAVVGGGLALLLSAPLLLPFAENLAVSGEWQRRTGYPFNRFEAPWPEAVGRLAPAFVFHAYGDPLADPERSLFAGPDNAAELGGGSLGMAALLLALLGTAWRPRQTWPWLVLGLLGLLISAQTPGIGRLASFVPFLGVSLSLVAVQHTKAGIERLSMDMARWRLVLREARTLPMKVLAEVLEVLGSQT